MLDECIIVHIGKENMTKIFETKREKKRKLKQLEIINLFFVGNDLNYFVINKTKMLFELFRIHDMTEYISNILRS